MKIQGTFIDITNTHTYWIQIGQYGITKEIKEADDYDPEDTSSIFFSQSPVSITSEMSDTFENVYIRNASISLVANFDLRDLVIANNYTDIPVEIRYDDEEGDIIFSGFVVPLQYDQPFAQVYTELTVECVDKLGILEYLKFKPLLSSYNYDTPKNFIDLILNECDFSNIDYSNLQYYDCITDTKINPIIFIGESEDDWMNCKEVLEEIGKIYGCYFYQNGDDCIIENIMLYDLSTQVNVTKDDYKDNDTSISIQEAYNRIECQVDLVGMKETLVDPFSDNSLEYVTNRPERVLSEICYNLGNKQKWDLFLNFRDRIYNAGGINSYPLYTNWQQYDNNDENFSEYDYYCRVMKNDSFDFGSHNYLNDGYGNTCENVYRTLEWLHLNPGKGAFLQFNKTDNLVDTKKRSTLDIDNETQQMLLIQVGGHGRSYANNTGDSMIISQAQELETQFYNNKPVCSIEVTNANNFIPNDVNSTNYLVISGKLRLNPLQCRTGYWYDRTITSGSYNSDPFYPWNSYVMSSNTIQDLLDNWAQMDWSWGTSYYEGGAYSGYNGIFSFWNSIVYKNNNDKNNGLYYQHYCWDNIQESGTPDGNWPFNQTPNFNRKIALPYLTPNTYMAPYDTSSYTRSNQQTDVNGIVKLAILACELTIGEGADKKYLIENLDALQNINYKQIPIEIYSQLYQWKTYDECPVKDGVKQTWFTIGANVDKGDYILGKELEIQNTVSSQMLLPSNTKGTAIPITSTDQLQGKLSFKILGPYNMRWTTNKIVKHGWEWWKYFGFNTNDRYLMDYVENIQITDFQIKPYANGQIARINNTKNLDDKDLVYYSHTNDIYKEIKEYSCKLCTCLTNEDAKELGINFGLSNSTILTTDNEAFYGFTYKNVDDVKLEEARVSEHYNIWKRPRSIIQTTLDLVDPEKAYLKTNYRFSYLKYNNNTPHVYRTLAREIDLKKNNMVCTMKELSEIPS